MLDRTTKYNNLKEMLNQIGQFNSDLVVKKAKI